MKYFLIVIFAILVGYASACDICGCAIGGYQFGILPNYRQHYISLRYQYSHFYSYHNEGQSEANDFIHQLELWGRYSIAKRLQLYAVVPYRFVHRSEAGSDQYFNGVGDASFLVHYSVVDQSSSQSKWKHLFQLGAGIKLPTGNYQIIKEYNTIPAPLQPGTGSFDYIATLIYVLRYKNSGISSDLNYRWNSQNPKKYQFGNKASSSARFFHLLEFNKLGVLPFVGLSYEFSEKNRSYEKEILETGVHNLSATAGFDFYLKNISIGASSSVPLKQDLNDGQTKIKSNFQINLNYYF